jgi:hypothetical protein
MGEIAFNAVSNMIHFLKGKDTLKIRVLENISIKTLGLFQKEIIHSYYFKPQKRRN